MYQRQQVYESTKEKTAGNITKQKEINKRL